MFGLAFLPGNIILLPMPELNVPYLTGSGAAPKQPLARYLPALTQGAALEWLAANVEPGSWILDPFGSSPLLALEAARAGYRVLVAANNPVSRALLEVAGAAPGQGEIQAALAELASSYRGEERIEPHLLRVYETPCESCSRMVSAEAYLWERETGAPYARIYHCPNCGDRGERPAVQHDLDQAGRYASGGLHRARALERVAPRGDPDRLHAEEALAVYIPRAVYVLFTLINKLDGIQLSPLRRKILNVLMLHACDQATSMWAPSGGRERPRQLSVPTRFRENNVWTSLEQGAVLLQELSARLSPAPVTTWPELPQGAGIVLFEGRLKDLAAAEAKIIPSAGLTALPRPNQAFWTLSALWSGWLWGAEAAGPLKMVLRRRRYDWPWHTAALSSVFSNLAALLPEKTPLLALTSEAEPGLVSAALLAANTAGFQLEGVALRADTGQAQFHWRKPAPRKPSSAAETGRDPVVTARRAAQELLHQRGQPASYLSVYTAALSALAQENLLQENITPGENASGEPTPALHYSRIQNTLKEAFTWRGGFLRLEGSEHSLEVGQWWLRESKPGIPPLADQVEIALVRFLTKNPGAARQDLQKDLFERFKGLHTPERDLVDACLVSYAVEDEPGSDLWRIRPQDAPAARRKDLEEARQLVWDLGKQLGFEVQRVKKEGPAEPVLWKDMSGSPIYVFYVIASAVFGEIILDEPPLAAAQVIVLPGSRASLALYKLRTDARLRGAAEKHWHLVKYRLLRRLVGLPLHPGTFEEQLKLDPLTATAAQIQLL
jgi:hypothetical protein